MPEPGEPRGRDFTDLVNITVLRGMLWRQRVILVVVTLLVLVAALVITLMTTPLYKATATIRINTDAVQIVEGQDLTTGYMHPNMIYSYVETLADVVRSYSMAQRVAAEMSDSGLEADALQGGITAEPSSDSQIMAISFTASDPKLAADVANRYAAEFLADDVRQAVEANAYARTYLEEQIADVQQKLAAAEGEANNYTRSNRLIGQPMMAGSGETAGIPATLNASNLYEINSAYTSARARRIEAEQKWAAVSGVSATQLPEVQQNSAIQSLRADLASKEGELADLSERYREDFPAVREAQAEVRVLRSQIANTAAEIKNGLRNEMLVARQQEAGLSRERERLSDVTLDEQDRRVQFNLIDRDIGSLRNQLAVLLQRYNEINSAANLRSNKITMLDPARVPSAPISPNLLKNLVIGFILGAGLAALIAILRETLDDRLHSVEELESKLGIVGLGQTPYTDGDIGEASDNPFSPLSESYSSIRASLDFMILQSHQKIVQFTSSQAGEGKTSSSLSLARKYASIGKRVLIVDMDLRRPTLHKHLIAKRPNLGVVDVMHSRVSLQDAIVRIGPDHFDFLPVSELPKDPVGILSSGLVPEFFEKLRQAYDIVIIDSSPVLGIADAPLLSRHTDGVVFIAEANRTHARHARASLRRLEDSDAQIIGGIMTKFKALDAGQSYSYQYRYYSYHSDND